MTHIIPAALTLALSLSAFSAASANTLRNGNSYFGMPAPVAQSTRVVDATTAGDLNVRCGDIVTFRNGDQQFSWKFEVITHRTVSLQDIAPQGFPATPMKVYVSRNAFETEY